MPTIKHRRQITEEEAETPGAEIKREEWNEGHTIELGSAKLFVGLDADKASVEAEKGNLYMATDTRELHYYDGGWESAFRNVVRSLPPPGGKRILNFWWDPDTREFVYDIEE